MLDQKNRTVARVIENARRRLLETGTRNRLVHVNRANQRANCLNIINELSDEVFGILRASSRRMRFKAMGRDRDADGGDMLLAVSEDVLEDGSERHTDQFLETPLGPEGLARRLLRLAGDAKTAEEEQGLNILYLSLGFLRWRESASSEVTREAPLVLLPVELIRNERTSTFDIRARDDDIATNLPLKERLRQDFGIALPEIEETESWLPSSYFDAVAEAVSAQPGWSIDRNGMQLGFFSFAKLLMHRDLDPDSWPDGSFGGNDLVAGLLVDGFDGDRPVFGPNDRLDGLLDPAEIIQVVDADASQTKVIEEVRRGRSLVVQGPPGTGKSQTITNLIAAAVHDGRTVLFVAEKMAALSVVHDRLVRTGLRDVCLELHSRTANKKALAQELERTLAASTRPLPQPGDAGPLRATRDDLNRIADLLHAPLTPDGDSPFRAMSEIIGFIGKGRTPPSIPLEGLDGLSREARASALDAIRRYVAALALTGVPGEHPFRGTSNLDLQPTDLSRLERELAEAVASLDALIAEAGRIAAILKRPPPETLAELAAQSVALAALAGAPPHGEAELRILHGRAGDRRLEEALAAGADWRSSRDSTETIYSAAAWKADLSAIRPAIVRGQASFLARWFGPYRRCSAEFASLLAEPLPRSPQERLALVDRLAEVQEKRRRLAEDEAWLSSALGEIWRGERTPFADLGILAQWLARVMSSGSLRSADDLIAALGALPDPEGVAAKLEGLAAEARVRASQVMERLRLDLQPAGLGDVLDTTRIEDLLARLAAMRAETSRYADWAGLARAILAVDSVGAGAIVAAVRDGRLEPDRAADEFAYACAEARWNAARQMRPELDRLPSLDRHELVTVFRDLERDRLDEVRTLILARHFEQVPKGSVGEMGIIRGEIARKRGHKPIRWVVKNAGSMVQRIKPVMLMSPISVAQFLPPGSVSFDLLVIDEASQVRPEDALGVVARARQIVVVGDQKQLPPTSFFDRLVDEDDEEEEDEEAPVGATAADMESILSLCEAKGLRSRMLEWHYRSRDPSLIQVSNAEFYDDNLVLPPSPLQLDDNYGLKFTRVPGVYVRGGSGLGRKGTNRIEAEAVVRAVARHARDWPDLSLGIVAFSKAQADMLTEVLEHERREDPVLNDLLREGRGEDVFVKNIENVQGDERDVILISVGYGPQEPGGRLAAMTFGPVNGEGGERRLNVLFSRARVRCEVFCSFDPGDIDPGRTKREGPRVLKRFLDFAKTGVIDQRAPTGLGADSPFEEDVARLIRSLGYEADPQVGSSGFRIDIGVRHPDRPGQYIAAVECDGAAYHSALWARERDRLRQDILENLGWRFHRIWSTDWFHRRDHEIRRLAASLEAARSGADAGIRVRGANAERQATPPPAAPVSEEPLADVEELRLKAPPYRRTDLQLRTAMEPHEAPLAQLCDLVAKIVEIEGPIHVEEVARRVSSAFGKARTGRRIVEVTMRAIGDAIRQGGDLRREGEFVMTAAQSEAPPVRDRSAETGTLLKAEYLPPSEIRAAVELLRRESGEMDDEETLRSVARLLGFQRVGSDLAAAIGAALREVEHG